MEIKKGKILRTMAAFMVGAIIIILLINKIGFYEAYDALKAADTFYVFVAISTSLFSIYLAGFRWKYIINGDDTQVSNRPLFYALLSGNFINNITPAGKGGGEPLRAYILSKLSGVDGGKIFATVISDRIFDTMPYILLGYFGILNITLFRRVPDIVLVSLILAILLLTAILGIVLYLLFNVQQGKRFVALIVRFLKRFIPDKIHKYEDKLEDTLTLFNSTIREIAHDRRKIIISSIVSIAIWGFWILRTYFVFLAFGVSVSFTTLAVVAVISSFVSLVPFSPGGFGTTDGAMIILFSAFGIDPYIALGATLVDRFISYWLPIVMGAFTFWLSHREINRYKNNLVKV